MIMISIDTLCEIFKKQLKEKRDDTIKCIDNSLQTASELKNVDKDMIFDDVSDYFIQEFSSTVVTIEATVKALYTGINIPEPINIILDEIKNLKYFIGFLTNFTNTIREYKNVRKEFGRWIKD